LQTVEEVLCHQNRLSIALDTTRWSAIHSSCRSLTARRAPRVGKCIVAWVVI
jgi:hypothetical protein